MRGFGNPARLATRALALSVLWIALGCAGRSYAPSIETPEVGVIQQEMIANFYASRARVRRIGYRLRSLGAPLCGSFRTPDGGLLLEMPHSSAAEGSVRAFLQPATASPTPPSSGVTVRYVVPESVLGRNDVRPGDVLLRVDATPIEGIEQYNLVLLETRGRPIELGFQRGTDRYAIRVRIPELCSISIDYSEDPGLMTFSQDGPGGERVAVPFGLLDAADDTFLAIAISHQIAHALLEFSSDAIDDPEATADRLGLLIAAQAGFDVRRGPAFWEWLAAEEPWRISRSRAFRLSRPHPWRLDARINYPTSELHLGIASRMAAIRETVDEIVRAQQSR